MIKEGFISSIATKSGLTKKDTELFYKSMVETIKETLANGEEIKLVKFQNFEINEIAEKEVAVKVGHPELGKKMQPAHKKVSVKLCKEIKELLK